MGMSPSPAGTMDGLKMKSLCLLEGACAEAVGKGGLVEGDGHC